MRQISAISIVVPTYNEADNVSLLMRRIDQTMRAAHLQYEVIFVDDHSTDETNSRLDVLAQTYPLRTYKKRGDRGKANSLLQGFKYAQYDTICMIDADLQYPPEAIVSMYDLMQENNADIVLTRRVDNATNILRKAATNTFNFVFTRMLFGFNYDSQSGLKMFQKRVMQSITVTPSPWSFDLEFIVRSLEKNYKILSYDIPFSERNAGEAKVNVLATSFELASAALTLRVNTSIKDVRRAYRMNLKLAEKAFGLLAIVGLSLFGASFVGSAPKTVEAAALNLGVVSVQIPLEQLLQAGQTQTQPQAQSNPQASSAIMQPQAGTAMQPAAADVQTSPAQPSTAPNTAAEATAAGATSAQTSSAAQPARLAVASTAYGKLLPTGLTTASTYQMPAEPKTSGLSRLAVILSVSGAALIILVALYTLIRKLHKKARHEK